MQDQISWDLVFPEYDVNILKQYCQRYNQSAQRVILLFSANAYKHLSCAICFADEPSKPAFLNCCSSRYCYDCISTWLIYFDYTCPHCRSKEFTLSYLTNYESLKSILKRTIDIDYLDIKIWLERKEQDGIPSHQQLRAYCEPCIIHEDCKIEFFCQGCRNRIYCTKAVQYHTGPLKPVSFYHLYLYRQRLLLNIVFDLDAYVEHLRRQGPSERLDEMEKFYQEIKDLINYQAAPSYVVYWPKLRIRLVEALQDWPNCTYHQYERLYDEHFLHPKMRYGPEKL